MVLRLNFIFEKSVKEVPDGPVRVWRELMYYVRVSYEFPSQNKLSATSPEFLVSDDFLNVLHGDVVKRYQ